MALALDQHQLVAPDDMAQGGAEWVAESAVEETRSKAERTESAGGESAQAGAREHSPGEGTRQGAPDHRRPGKSCRAAGIEPRGRDELVKAAEALATYVGVKPACDALRVARATFYRRRRPSTGHQQPRPTPARALSEKERDKVFDTLCSERFVDRSPAEVVATLLDEDVYLCSERTMYRVLASQVPVRERRAQRSHPEYQKPELMAFKPAVVAYVRSPGSCCERRTEAVCAGSPRRPDRGSRRGGRAGPKCTLGRASPWSPTRPAVGGLVES